MSLVSRSVLQTLRPSWQKGTQRVVFTNGVFDLLHIGHVEYLQQARALGDLLIVGINSDDSTRSIKGPSRPLMPEQARAGVLTALRCVDYVTIFTEPTAETLVATLQPDIYVKGGDYAVAEQNELLVDDHRLPEARIVRGYGGQVFLLPYRAGYSTTALLERIEHLRSIGDAML